MLIQITNRCYMQCPHCMMDSVPDGQHMTEETFEQVFSFVAEARPLVISVSGGEPTENPLWEQMVRRLLEIPSARFVNLLTNGSWIEDKDIRLKVANLTRQFKDRFGVQVYSHPKYYQDHDWTVEHEAQFRSVGCKPDFSDTIFMQDLGRARKNCSEEVEQSDHVPSCINSHLLALQAYTLQQFVTMAAQAGKFCRPLIDFQGGIHMSESRLCPTVAHVSDGTVDAFMKMRASRPCKGCRLYRNFEQLHAREMEILNR